MSRFTRNRAYIAGLVMAVGASTLGIAYARTDGYGATSAERGEALSAALEAYTEAVRTCDLETMRLAYRDAEEVFNAVEIDHQFASPERYMFFEHIYIQDQVPSGLGLEGDDPYDCETNLRLAEEQEAAWDEVVEFLALTPEEDIQAFTDLAVIRGVNQGLRAARAALSGNPDATPQTPSTAADPARAAERWAQFVADYPAARALIAFRNEELATELDGLVDAVTTAFAGDPAQGFPGASEAMAALAARWGFGQNLVTAAARNSLPSLSTQPVFDPDAFSSVDFLGDLLLTLFDIEDTIDDMTPEAAALIETDYLDWIQYPLSFKTGGALTRASTAADAAIAAFKAAQTPQTAQALKDQVKLWEQIFVGQYWGTPELEEFYAENR